MKDAALERNSAATIDQVIRDKGTVWNRRGAGHDENCLDIINLYRALSPLVRVTVHNASWTNVNTSLSKNGKKTENRKQNWKGWGVVEEIEYPHRWERLTLNWIDQDRRKDGTGQDGCEVDILQVNRVWLWLYVKVVRKISFTSRHSAKNSIALMAYPLYQALYVEAIDILWAACTCVCTWECECSWECECDCGSNSGASMSNRLSSKRNSSSRSVIPLVRLGGPALSRRDPDREAAPDPIEDPGPYPPQGVWHCDWERDFSWDSKGLSLSSLRALWALFSLP